MGKVVDESKWVGGADPKAMLNFLLSRHPSDRKLRLFNCACWRLRALRFLRSGGRGLLEAVGASEAFADGTVKKIDPRHCKYYVAGRSTQSAARWTIQTLSDRPRLGVPASVLACLLRDLFGNPFQPLVLDPTLRTPAVLALAQATYENRALPAGTLDPKRLAILADALEEAGCTDADILGHLRGPGPHVRGCFVLDTLLDKS